MTSDPSAVVIGLDLGGTWIKGVAQAAAEIEAAGGALAVTRWRNPIATTDSAETYGAAVMAFCRDLAAGRPVRAVVASTAGEVDAGGRRYLIAGAHLGVMATTPWREVVEAGLGCPVTLINDAEAFVLGLASQGQLDVSWQVGALVVGTGLGFSVVRSGRWWKPSRRLNFLGCAWTGEGTYDGWASAVQAAGPADGDLVRFLSDPQYAAARDRYLEGLARMLASAAVLYHLDEVVLGGGLVDAAAAAGLEVRERLAARLPELVPPVFSPPRLRVVVDGNGLILRGILNLAAGNAVAEPARHGGGFSGLGTEGAGTAVPLEERSPAEIARHLAEAERQAAIDFVAEAPALGAVAERMAEALRAGGRVIYVGAGTSGRVGALDAVEMPCTFGVAEDRFVAVVAGGVADAPLTIEGNAEEDCSAVPDVLLLQPGPRDVVLGLSASGTAFFVRSALACARSRGAYTVLVHEGGADVSALCDAALRLHSGAECIRGSTRMKAGTATKKVLNILSTTAMIRLGKVRRGYMIDLVASNDKLRRRAERMLADLAGLSVEQARARLEQNGYRVRAALDMSDMSGSDHISR